MEPLPSKTDKPKPEFPLAQTVDKCVDGLFLFLNQGRHGKIEVS